MLFRNHLKAFGLDISDRVLRIVNLGGRGGRPTVLSVGELALPENLITAGEIRESDQVAAALTRLVSSVKGDRLTTRYVAACLPERKSFIKVIQVPREKAEVNEAIEFEISQHIPFKLDEVYLDWQRLPATDDGMEHLLVAACPKTIVDVYTEMLHAAGLEPVILEVESVAVARAIIDERTSPQLSTLLVDIGRDRSSFIIWSAGTIHLTASSVAASGRVMTDAIIRALDFNDEQAERAKSICGLDPRIGRGVVKRALGPAVDELIRIIKNTLTFQRSHFPLSRPIEQIIMTGGSAKMLGLSAAVAAAVGVPAVLADTSARLSRFAGSRLIPPAALLSYPTAIGLALRGAGFKE